MENPHDDPLLADKIIKFRRTLDDKCHPYFTRMSPPWRIAVKIYSYPQHASITDLELCAPK
jgi:hypothetical protein